MLSTFSQRAKLTTAAVVTCLLLTLVALRPWPSQVPVTLDLRLAGLRQVTNGVFLVSIVLSNGTSRTLNVVDDTAGNPLFLLDAGTGGASPGNGTYGSWLGEMANRMRVNLAPGASLANSVWVTNPPPRFRLRVNVRDLAAESRGLPIYRVVGKAAAMKLAQWRQNRQNVDAFLPASAWIEPGLRPQ